MGGTPHRVLRGCGRRQLGGPANVVSVHTDQGGIRPHSQSQRVWLAVEQHGGIDLLDLRCVISSSPGHKHSPRGARLLLCTASEYVRMRNERNSNYYYYYYY